LLADPGLARVGNNAARTGLPTIFDGLQLVLSTDVLFLCAIIKAHFFFFADNGIANILSACPLVNNYTFLVAIPSCIE
jgi:hypothetical protein